MGINSNPETKRAYQREWIAKRRTAWFKENGPCSECGSNKKLELHHVDPTQKVANSIWSWSKQRRDEETKKCVVLCYDCHKKESLAYHKRLRTGSPSPMRQLSEQSIVNIYFILKNFRISERKLSKLIGVHRSVISHIRLGYIYKNFLPSDATGSMRLSESLYSGS